MPGAKLLYIADPMCSWCWGFSPVIKRVFETYGRSLSLDLVMGGLRPGTTEIMNAETGALVRDHWRHVTQLSGQTFNYEFFDRTTFIYDTEPPSRALVTVRLMHPGLTFNYLDSLHRAFYQQNLDITDSQNLTDLAAALGIEPQLFAKRFVSQETRTETFRDFYRARQLGVTGFPTLIGIGNREPRVITAGYRSFDMLSVELERFLVVCAANLAQDDQD